MELVYQYVVIFFNFQTTSCHLDPLQVENCGSNSRLVVDQDDYGKFRIQGINQLTWLMNTICIIFRISDKVWIYGRAEKKCHTSVFEVKVSRVTFELQIRHMIS